jgi:ammonia channel protein AmtB
MALANIAVGALLLVLGRKLFWLFVAASGFVAGLLAATRLLNVEPEWAALLIGLAVGVVGAFAAVVIQRIAIGVAGFLAGAFVAATLAGAVGFERGAGFWTALVVGGVTGAILVAVTFDWALIFLSSLAGGSAIMEGLGAPLPYAWIGVLMLCIVGVLIQTAIKQNERGRPPEKRA